MPSADGHVTLGRPGGLVGLGAAAGPPRPGRWGWLRSQGLGICCGLATVALLAIGSVVLAATRDGASAGVGLDDLAAFFARPHLAHLWLYALVPVAALYALNTLLATWETVTTRWRSGLRTPRAYAAAVLHLAFLVALLAHLAGGFLSREGGSHLLTEGWQPLPGFGEARLASLQVDELPNGMPREVRAAVELRDPAGRVETSLVGYNQPLSGGWGSRLALLSDLGQTPVARLASGEATCALAQEQRCLLGGEPVEVLAFAQPRGPGSFAALVRAAPAQGGPPVRWLAPGELLALRNGRPLQLIEVAVVPAVALRVREAPGNPLALLAALLLAAGVLMMWRRLIALAPG
jgi:hypothetical protein